MQNSLITIIVPVYNAEKNIKKCINSLIAQTYTNIEIVCADDCSTDKSYSILKEYEKQDERVKVFSTGTNGGPGKARNIGLENAHGEYIMFCDNDDYYSENMCEKMLYALIENNVDIVTCKSEIINKTSDYNLAHFANSNSIGAMDITNKKFPNINVYVWNKIYKKSLIDKYNIHFTTRFAEDDLFTFMYIAVANSYFGLNDKLYNYIVSKDTYTFTIGRGKDPTKKFHKLYNIQEYVNFILKFNLLEKASNYFEIYAKGQLFYIFAHFNISVFDLIYIGLKYNHYVKKLKMKQLSFYNVYLKYKTPWFVAKLIKMSYWF